MPASTTTGLRKIMAQIGKGFAEAMAKMSESPQ